MSRKWFGSQRELYEFNVPCWIKRIRMTATATYYNQLGFAIAADGNQLWQDRQSYDAGIRDSEHDHEQKIFGIQTEHVALGYVIRGDIAGRGRSFDLAAELRSQLAILSSKDLLTCEQLLKSLAIGLEAQIEMAVHDRRLEELPATQIDFAGYFNSQPCWMELQFHPFYNQVAGRLYEIYPKALYPGACFISGSLIVGELIRRGDPRFMRFCAQFDPEQSMKDAAGYVNGYIEACCSPEALLVDPGCEGLGGHIHVATVTPEHGFDWVVPPIDATNP
jgi:hypothetical protein